MSDTGSPTRTIMDRFGNRSDKKEAEKPKNYYLLLGIAGAGTAAWLAYQAYQKRTWFEGLTKPSWAPSSLILHMALRIINFGVIIYSANDLLMKVDAEDKIAEEKAVASGEKAKDVRRSTVKMLTQILAIGAIVLDAAYAYFFFSKASYTVSFTITLTQFVLQVLLASVAWKVESVSPVEEGKERSYKNTILLTGSAAYSLFWAVWNYSIKTSNEVVAAP